MSLQLLKRPRPLPAFRDEEQGIHAQWGIKGFYFRRNGLPKMSIKGKAYVQYASLVVEGKYLKTKLKIPLVSIGYVESEQDILDVRGCDFRILLVGVDCIETIRDWLRFLVIRQRVPHSLMGKSFEWQDNPVKEDNLKQLKVSKISPLHCFKIW